MLTKIQEFLYHILNNSFLNRNKLLYDFGVLFYGIGVLMNIVFSFYGLAWIFLIVGIFFIFYSEKNQITKLATLFIFPILVIIFFFILLFSGGNEFVLFLFALIFTFPFLKKLMIWIGKTKARINITVVIISILIITRISIFAFSKMKVIQSQIYPNLYLIDNLSSNQDSIESLIKKISLENLNKDFIGKEYKHRFYNEDSSKFWISYNLNFYEYTTSGIEGGTSHFIKNEQDWDGGFSDNTLQDHHKEAQIAMLNIEYCKNDTLNYYVTIDYYRRETLIKTDTLIKNCKKEIDN